MKQLIGAILIGLTFGLIMFAGLSLDDKVEQLKEASQYRFSEIDNAIR